MYLFEQVTRRQEAGDGFRGVAAGDQLRPNLRRTGIAPADDRRGGLGWSGRGSVLDGGLLRRGHLRVDQRRMVGAVIDVDGMRKKQACQQLCSKGTE